MTDCGFSTNKGVYILNSDGKYIYLNENKDLFLKLYKDKYGDYYPQGKTEKVKEIIHRGNGLMSRFYYKKYGRDEEVEYGSKKWKEFVCGVDGELPELTKMMIEELLLIEQKVAELRIHKFISANL